MTRNLLFVFTALLACCACSSAWAQAASTQQAELAREAGKAADQFEQAIEALDTKRSELQFLAEIFREVERNPAEYDNGRALYRMGGIFEQGDDELGLKPNPFAAVQWYKKAAKHGHIQSQVNLGWIYLEGRTGVGRVGQNYAEAAKWFQQAAEQGDWNAQLLLAILHIHGQGVRKSDAEAEKWLEKAIQNGVQADGGAGELLERFKKMPFADIPFSQFR